MKGILYALLSRCPACGQGPLFSGLYSCHEKCSACGSRFERFRGAWTVAVYLTIITSVGAAGGTAIYLAAWDALPPGIPYNLVGLAVAVALVSYRINKAVWVGVMAAAFDAVHPDAIPDDPRVIQLDQYRERRRSNE